MQSPTTAFSLARFFEEVRVVEAVGGRGFDVERLPDGRTTLFLRVLEEGHKGDLTIAGPRSRAMFKHATGVVRVIIIPFKPGWSSPLIGVAANALTDRIVHLQEIWGRSGGDLCAELVSAPSVDDALNRLSRAFEQRTSQTFEPGSGRLARHAVRLLEAGEDRVETIAAQLGVTSRHLRRAFLDSIGIGPKEFARTVRLRRAVQSTATSNDWARIATDAGYYDQAHLIADFQKLVGLTPGAYVKRSAARNALKSASRASTESLRMATAR